MKKVFYLLFVLLLSANAFAGTADTLRDDPATTDQIPVYRPSLGGSLGAANPDAYFRVELQDIIDIIAPVNAYLYVRFASESDGTGFASTQTIDLPYRCEIQSTTPIVPVVGDCTGRWVNTFGEDGQGFEPCNPGDNDCGAEFPRNTSTPSWSPRSGFGGIALGGDNVWYCNPTGGSWVTCASLFGGTGAIWGNITGDIANQLDLQAVLNDIVQNNSGYVSTPPTYSNQACTPREWSIDSGHVYFCSATDTWERIALDNWSNPLPTNPELNLASIGTDGTTLTLTFSENVSQGAGYNDEDLDLDCTEGSNISLEYDAGNGTASHTYTIAETIYQGSTCNLDFNGDANSLEDGGGADLAAIVSGSVSNGSTQTAGEVILGHPDTTPTGTGSSPASSMDRVADASFTAQSVWTYVGSTGRSLKGFVYNTATGALLGETEIITTAPGTWQCADLSSSVSIVDGTTYRIGWAADQSILYYRTAGAYDRWGLTYVWPTLPDPFAGDSTSDYNLAVRLSSITCP